MYYLKLISIFNIMCLSNFGYTTINCVKIINHLNSKTELALTFDDGPDHYNTEKVLKILDKYNIKATFFTLGESIEKNKDILLSIYEHGHKIGIHSYTHPNFSKMNYDEIKKEIVDTQNLIYQITNYKADIIRPPYGATNDDFLKVVQDLRLTPYTWSQDSFDWCTKNDDTTIIKNVTTGLKGGQIILMHDKSNNITHSRGALPSIINYALDQEYKFVKLTNSNYDK